MSNTDSPAVMASGRPAHPGFEWLADARCANLDPGPSLQAAEDEASSNPFFVDAGRVIDDVILRMCQACPVRRECVIHSYIGGPNESMIGAGYFGGFSLGQRKSMTLQQALARLENERRAPRQGTLL